MTLSLDIHHNVNATPEDVEKAHLSDLEAQEKHGVKYLKYWFDPTAGRICCLVDRGRGRPDGGVPRRTVDQPRRCTECRR